MDEEKARYSKPEPPEADQFSSDHSSEDTFLSPEAFSGRKKVENIDISPSVSVDKDASNKPIEKSETKVHIDTAAPFESVKEAVSKFGGIVDWKAHRVQTNERRQYIEQELEKAEQEIPVYRKKSEEAEQAKEQALRDLDSTKRLIGELKLNLERARTEEHQAQQDSELAQLRVQEMEQGIEDESSVAAKTQLEVAKARLEAAASELHTATNDLEETRKDYQVLMSERDSAVQKAQEAVSAAKEIEREVESLTIQLITTKESIESTHALHLEAEEHRIQEVNEKDQEALNLDQELKQTEEELEKVKQQIVLAKDLRSKLETSSGLLQNLKDELAIYMQGKVPDESEEDKFTRKDIQSGVAIAKKNLDEVHSNIERTTEEIMCLKTAAKSLTAKLESEKAVLTNVRKQKGLGAGAVVNLESELKQTRLELDSIRKKEKEAREKLMELPKQLKKVTEETESAKRLAEGARLILKKAKEQAEESKSGANSVESRLAATQKEIDSARAQEKLALGAISALQESESARGQKDPKGGVTISLEEYYELSKKGYEAEEAASKRVEEAMAKIDAAKDSEMQSLIKLTELNSEISARKEALNVALQKAEVAKESTMNIEEELKKRKGEKVEPRKGLSQKGNQDPTSSPSPAASNSKSNTKGGAPEEEEEEEEEDSNASEATPEGKGFFRRRKKVIMPKFSFMFMGKKKPLFNKNS